MEIYLDNAASTKVYDEVADLFRDLLVNNYANPSAVHIMGSKAADLYITAKNKMLEVSGLKGKRVIFTSGATESTNFAIKGIMEKFRDVTQAEIITSNFEHPCVSNVAKYYEKKGVKVHWATVNRLGQFDEESILSNVNDKTKIISLIFVNNEIGSINDVSKIFEKAKKINPRVLTHVDATQGFGKVDYDFKYCDMISISAHKFHAPKGIGALIVDPKLVLDPQMLGGGHQDNYRSGTINAPGIAAMAKALEIMKENKVSDTLRTLQEYLYKKVADTFGEDVINSKIYESSFAPHILSLSFEGLKGEVIVHMLEDNGIYVSTSSACSSNHKSSHSVLESLGFSQKRIEGTIRVSISEFTTTDELDTFVETLKPIITRLKELYKIK